VLVNEEVRTMSDQKTPIVVGVGPAPGLGAAREPF
jgi:hypothetical protein